MAVGLRSANFPVPLSPHQGIQVLTNLPSVETRGAKLEYCIIRQLFEPRKAEHEILDVEVNTS